MLDPTSPYSPPEGKSFTFAHLSDPHLAMIAGWPRPLNLLAGKRLLGFISWRHNRQNIHLGQILNSLVTDISEQHPDHVVITGDLVNISLPQEFIRARHWLESMGDPASVSVVPGNHDATVEVPWEQGLGLWQPWMTGDDGRSGFPFARIRGPVAFVGISTAIPTAPFLASGRVGKAQLAQVERLLTELGQKSLFRVVLMHHPPLMGHGGKRKALRDREAVAAGLLRSGAELVLHGHHHRASISEISNGQVTIPVVGVASASGSPERGPQGARWVCFDLSPDEGGGWLLRGAYRTYRASGFQVEHAFTHKYPARTAKPRDSGA